MFILLLFLTVILQVSFLPFFSLNSVYPNIVLMVLILLTVMKQKKGFLFYTLMSGLFLEFFSNFHFGAITLILWLTIYLIDFLAQNILMSSKFLILIILPLAGILFYRFLLLSYFYFSHQSLDFKYIIFYQIPVEIFYNLGIFWGLYFFATYVFIKKIQSQKYL